MAEDKVDVGHTYRPTKRLPDPDKDKIGKGNEPRWVTEKNFEYRKSQGYEPVEPKDGVVTEVHNNRLMRISKEHLDARRKHKMEKLDEREARLKAERSKGLKGKQSVIRDGKTVLRED